MRGTAAAGAADAPPASGGTRDPGRAAPGGAQAQPSAPARGGPDLGWVLACIGLLLAAAVLGLSEDGRKATGRSGRRLAGFLRPLVGRR
jgi:hypothetical protein